MKNLAIVLVLLSLPVVCLAADSSVPSRHNENGPTEGIKPMVLNELWRAGGEDEEIIFGRIVDVKMDQDQNVYVLDNQLCQVLVFSKDGQHLRDLSRNGEGPGEVSQPIGLALLPDDSVGIGVGYPGKIVSLKKDGTPITSYHPIGEVSDGNIGVMMGIQLVDDVLVACGGRLVFGQNGEGHTNRFLSVTDAKCTQTNYVFEKTVPLDLTGQKYVEADDYYIDRRWALGPEGRIYAPLARDSYEISVCDPSGKIVQKFSRPDQRRKRTESEKNDVGPLINLNAHNPGRENIIEDYDPCITRLQFNHDDGTLWVLTPHGAEEQPEEILECWDVFSTDGEFLRQVPIPLGHEMNDGTCYLLGQQRLVVVKGTLSSFGNEQDQEEDEEEDEVEPMEVICYEIGSS